MPEPIKPTTVRWDNRVRIKLVKWSYDVEVKMGSRPSWNKAANRAMDFWLACGAPDYLTEAQLKKLKLLIGQRFVRPESKVMTNANEVER